MSEVRSEKSRLHSELFFQPYFRRVAVHTILSLLSAILLLLVFPRFDYRFLAPICLTPLLFAMAETRNGWQRFFYGWAAGICYWFFLCNWIQFVLEVHGNMGVPGSWGAFGLFCILKALHLAVFSWLAGPLMRRAYAIPAVAALWTGLERTHGTFGFAWLQLGNAGIDMSVPLRVAPYVGVYGISFIFAMMAAGVACVIFRNTRTTGPVSSAPPEEQASSFADWRRAAVPRALERRSRTWLAPLLVLGLLWFLPGVPQGIPTTDRALVVQPNINPETEWNSLFQSRVEQQLSMLSDGIPAPLVIWPELPAPLYFYSDTEFHDIALQIARRHASFLFETVAFNGENQPLNSAVMLNADGTEVGRYDQIDLVPFGEFVPPFFSWVNRITKETSDFVPGHDVKVFPAVGHTFGVFICYESAFPDLVRQFSKKGADVLVNLSNDGYFGRREAREQHLSLVRMRAVENRRFIIRSTNNGVTAVIDPAGRMTKTLPPYQEVSALINYGGVPGTTFYARHGDWFAWSCLAVGVGLAIFELFRSGRANQQD